MYEDEEEYSSVPLLCSYNPWGLAIMDCFSFITGESEMTLGKAVITLSYLKKNLSGKTISTSSCQQAKRASIVSFPLSQQTNVAVSLWIIACSRLKFDIT